MIRAQDQRAKSFGGLYSAEERIKAKRRRLSQFTRIAAKARCLPRPPKIID